MSIKEIISNNFNININKEDISPPSFVTKELISNSFSININKLEDIPPTVVEKEVISNSFNININKTSIPIDIPVESVSVNPNLKDMFVGDTFQIVYTITPSNATNKDVVFSSDNRSVATVNANTGVVEAKGVGECNITCTTVDGNKSDICNVTVREKAPDAIPVQSVTIVPKQLNLTVGEFHTFSYTIVPENATNKDVVFVSDNTEIATINGNTVTAVTEGSCKVYVRTLDGNKEDVCDLTVISNEIEGENTPPVLSVVLVSSERPDGSYVLNYNVIDKDQDEITHKLKIDNSEFTTINPNQDGIYCTYNGTGLTAGEHTGYIQISDGENTVTSKKFIINIPIETESIKEQLKLAKNNYDIKHDNLKNVINSIIEDRVFDEETEGYVLDNAFNEYNIALAKYREISQKAIDSIANKKSHDLQDKFNKDIIDINFAVNGLENTMNGAFKDGILTESEKLSIKQHLLTLSSEKSDVDKQYETIFANEHLEGQPKTNLTTAYNNYISSYNSLVTVINNILEKEGLIDSTDRSKLNNAFKDHDSKLGLYTEKATNALDAIAKKKAEVESEKLDKKFADIIIDLEEGITSKVEHLNKQVNGDGGISERLKLAEEKITEDGITQIVKDTQFIKDMDGKITTNSENITKIDQKADRIDLSVQSKVDGNSIISAINMSPETIKINASKINITGFVTFTDLSTAGKTTINGANIDTTNLRVRGELISGQINGVGGIKFADGAVIESYDSQVPGYKGISISAPSIKLGDKVAIYNPTMYYDVVGKNNTSSATTTWTMSRAGALTCASASLSETLNVNGVIYGMNNLALARGSIYIPSFGTSYTCDFIRGGNSSIAFADNGPIHFIYNGTKSSFIAGGSVYLPHAGNVNCDHFRLGLGVMASPSSGSFHFLTANGTTSPLYAGILYSATRMSLDEPMVVSSNSVFDKINSIDVIETKDGLRLYNPIPTTKAIDKSTEVVKTEYDEDKNEINTSIDYTSAISTLWKAIQELKQENEELKKLIKNNNVEGEL